MRCVLLYVSLWGVIQISCWERSTRSRHNRLNGPRCGKVEGSGVRSRKKVTVPSIPESPGIATAPGKGLNGPGYGNGEDSG
jgi:hypothetical protein